MKKKKKKKKKKNLPRNFYRFGQPRTLNNYPHHLRLDVIINRISCARIT